jgi:hypothetical protein
MCMCLLGMFLSHQEKTRNSPDVLSGLSDVLSDLTDVLRSIKHLPGHLPDVL